MILEHEMFLLKLFANKLPLQVYTVGLMVISVGPVWVCWTFHARWFLCLFKVPTFD